MNRTERRRLLRQYTQGSELYEKFSGHEAGPLEEVDAPIVPRVAIVVGYCDGLLYSSVRDGKLENYIHEFKKRDRPVFAVSPDGRQLMLIGGNYRFTEQGIVDRSERDK